MAMRSHSRFTLYWLLTLEVRLPNGWRGMVPMTRGSSRHSLEVPGTSTQTWIEQKRIDKTILVAGCQVGNIDKVMFTNYN